MQPTYLPWLGYFAMIDASDIFVLYDNVQFSKQSWQSRNRVLQKDNRVEWLSVPIINSGLDKLICETKFVHNGWEKKQLNKIHHIYSKTPHYEAVFSLLRDNMKGDYENIAQLNKQLLTSICEYLGISTTMMDASKLNCEKTDKNARLIEIIEKLDGNAYLSPMGAIHYIDPHAFLQSGIKVTNFDYQHPTYAQWDSEFTSHLSIIDLLFRYGEASIDIIRSGWLK